MKKLIALFILTFMISSLFIGCTQNTPQKGEDDVAADNNPSGAGDTDKEQTEDNNTNQTPDSEDNTNQTPDSEDNTNPEKPEDKPTDGNEGTGSDSTDPVNPPTDDPSETLPPVGTTVGYTFGDVALSTIDGGTVNTADYRGKIIILNIWATWCGPCISELPEFNEVATEYKDNVVIIAADIDGGYYGSKSYVEQNFPGTDIIFAYDTDKNDAYFAAGGDGYVPYTVIIDENGVIRYSDSGALSKSALVSLIESLIG